VIRSPPCALGTDCADCGTRRTSVASLSAPILRPACYAYGDLISWDHDGQCVPGCDGTLFGGESTAGLSVMHECAHRGHYKNAQCTCPETGYTRIEVFRKEEVLAASPKKYGGECNDAYSTGLAGHDFSCHRDPYSGVLVDRRDDGTTPCLMHMQDVAEINCLSQLSSRILKLKLNPNGCGPQGNPTATLALEAITSSADAVVHGLADEIQQCCNAHDWYTQAAFADVYDTDTFWPLDPHARAHTEDEGDTPSPPSPATAPPLMTKEIADFTHRNCLARAGANSAYSSLHAGLIGHAGTIEQASLGEAFAAAAVRVPGSAITENVQLNSPCVREDLLPANVTTCLEVREAAGDGKWNTNATASLADQRDRIEEHLADYRWWTAAQLAAMEESRLMELCAWLPPFVSQQCFLGPYDTSLFDTTPATSSSEYSRVLSTRFASRSSAKSFCLSWRTRGTSADYYRGFEKTSLPPAERRGAHECTGVTKEWDGTWTARGAYPTCENTCEFADDGNCDELWSTTYMGFNDCALGTDCKDCKSELGTTTWKANSVEDSGC